MYYVSINKKESSLLKKYGNGFIKKLTFLWIYAIKKVNKFQILARYFLYVIIFLVLMLFLKFSRYVNCIDTALLL